LADLVTTGGALKCSMGTTPATFSATSQSVVAPTGAGTVDDSQPANVPLFGLCQSMQNPAVSGAMGVPQPCTPMIAAPWSAGSTTTPIGQLPALDDSCQCQCAYFGKITVSSAGQTATTLQ
jgi:Domain of unknown function (DUF4280)